MSVSFWMICSSRDWKLSFRSWSDSDPERTLDAAKRQYSSKHVKLRELSLLNSFQHATSPPSSPDWVPVNDATQGVRVVLRVPLCAEEHSQQPRTALVISMNTLDRASRSWLISACICCCTSARRTSKRRKRDPTGCSGAEEVSLPLDESELPAAFPSQTPISTANNSEAK